MLYVSSFCIKSLKIWPKKYPYFLSHCKNFLYTLVEVKFCSSCTNNLVISIWALRCAGEEAREQNCATELSYPTSSESKSIPKFTCYTLISIASNLCSSSSSFSLPVARPGCRLVITLMRNFPTLVLRISLWIFGLSLLSILLIALAKLGFRVAVQILLF